MIELLTPLTGIFARFVVPLLFTVGFAYLLKRMDDRWRRESFERSASITKASDLPNLKCWEIRGCSAENRSNCAAYKQDTPCWDLKRKNGRLRQECLHCLVIQQALLPEGI